MRRLAFLLWLSLAGCPDTEVAPAATCARVGDKCTLGKNLLGVCNAAPPGATCDKPPCLICMSQH
jgi:hypothetical protein